MGPVNWLAVALSALLGVAIWRVWQLRLARHVPEGAKSHSFSVLVAMALSATMIGHNFARVGAVTLAAKPWLYWMMSGGLALAFVMPAVWLGALRAGAQRRHAALDCGYWLVAYLAMGTVFWALR